MRGQSAYFPRPSLWWQATVQLWSSGALAPALVATAKTFYASCCGISCGVATTSTTLVVSGGCWQAVTTGPSTDRWSIAADVHGSALDLYVLCPAEPIAHDTFTATPTTLTLFSYDTVTTYTKVH